jgi:hypothetical protein
MNLMIKGIGLFFFLEGVANVVYWNRDRQPWVFQAGRVARAVLGVYLIMAG